MQIYELKFSDGKSCTCLIPDPLDSDEANENDLRGIFQPGYMVAADRVIPRPPTKLPWKQARKGVWTLGLFVLKRLEPEVFHCFWPGGEVTGCKDVISAAVRLHWEEGLT